MRLKRASTSAAIDIRERPGLLTDDEKLAAVSDQRPVTPAVPTVVYHPGYQNLFLSLLLPSSMPVKEREGICQNSLHLTLFVLYARVVTAKHSVQHHGAARRSL